MLFIEGTSIAEDVKGFLRTREPQAKPSVQLETGWPQPATFHLPVTDDNLRNFARFLQIHALPEILDHLKAYRDNRLLLDWTDACSDPIILSMAINEDVLKEICGPLNCSYKRVGLPMM